MNKLFYSLGIWTLALLFALPGHAQYATTPPVQNGSIMPSEYNNNSYQTTDGGTWYMTWNASNLYVGKSGGQPSEPAIMYLDLNPISPVNGGDVTNGNLRGVTEYEVTPVLPFRADVRVSFTSTQVEVRRANGQGGWNAPVLTDLFVGNNGNGGTDREVRLSWQTLTGGGTIPPSFNWLGYVTNIQLNNANYRYDLAPYNGDAASYANSTSPQFPYYYTILSTANGAATGPFNLKSYTFVGTSDNYQIGDIAVWDFTMNSRGLNIGRGTTGKTWNISGSLIVGDGTLYFGSPAGSGFGDTFVGNLRMLGNGVLNMDQTNRALNVRESVYLVGGSQLILSGQQGGDLNVGRDFNVTNGYSSPSTFQSNTRAVSFTGSNVTHVISSDNNYVIDFNYLALSSPSSSITLNSSISVINSLNFNNGILYTGSNFVQLQGAAKLNNETATSHIIGNVRITKELKGGGSGLQEFGNIGLELTPQNTSSTRGFLTVTRVTGTTIPGVGMGRNGNSIQRYFVLTSADPSVTGLDLLLKFSYRPDELNGIMENNLVLYKSEVGTPGSFEKLTSPPSANTNDHSISYNYTRLLNSGTYLTVSDGVTPLPVKLVAFTAKATSDGGALLNWNTASEADSKGFGIERQLGSGEPWKSVGYAASSNLATGSTYAFSDKSLAFAPASTSAYYRLRQEDFNGTVSYSPVAVIVRQAATDAPALVLSPVPVSGDNLSLTFAEAGQAGSQVTISNTQGQRMLNLTTEASAEVALSLPVAKLTPGVYILSVQVPGQSPRYARFVKQ